MCRERIEDAAVDAAEPGDDRARARAQAAQRRIAVAQIAARPVVGRPETLQVEHLGAEGIETLLELRELRIGESRERPTALRVDARGSDGESQDDEHQTAHAIGYTQRRVSTSTKKQEGVGRRKTTQGPDGRARAPGSPARPSQRRDDTP